MIPEKINTIEKKLHDIKVKIIGWVPLPKDMDIYMPQKNNTDLLSGQNEKNKEAGPIRISAHFPIASDRRYAGRLVVTVKKIIRRAVIWLINPIVQQLNLILNSHQTYFQDYERRFGEIDKTFNVYQGYIKNIESHSNRVEKIIEEIAKKKNKNINDTQHERLLELFEHISDKVETSLENMSAELKQMRELIRDIEQQKIPQRLARYERFINKSRNINEIPEIKPVPVKNTGTSLPAFDYFVFEEKFRGDERMISQRQKKYAKYFKNKSKVLDIGCGRGEFLDILKSENIDGYGIDIDEDMIQICEEKGIEVYNEDALSHIQKVPALSLGGIFISQVVEHLESDYLFMILDLSFDKLEENGIFVAETLNPDSLLSMKYFYMDPSHVKPVPSTTFEFMLEKAGFSDIRVHYIESADEKIKLGKLSSDIADDKLQKAIYDQVNSNSEVLNKMLFGPVDYVITAYKKII